MNSPYNNPFANNHKPLVKNYADTFVEADYDHMSTENLESYARNLHNTLLGLLDQDPYPAALFEKLEKRHDGLLSMLKKRYAASNVSLDKKAARARLMSAQRELESSRGIKEEVESLYPPKKKARMEPGYVSDVKKGMEEIKLKHSSQSTQPVEEEEENFSINEEGE